MNRLPGETRTGRYRRLQLRLFQHTGDRPWDSVEREIENLGAVHVQIVLAPHIPALSFNRDCGFGGTRAPYPAGGNDQVRPPLPSVPYANGPIRAFGESSAVSRVAAAASPKIVRTLRSRGLRNLL